MLFRRAANFDLVASEHGTDLVVTGDWSPATAKALSRGKADGLVLNYAKGYRERSLEFLQDWPLRRIRILARTITDLVPVYRMAATLESISVITAPRAPLDLARLPKLTQLGAEWEQVESSIEAGGGLRDLYLGSYNPRDLTPLAQSTQLRSISMKDRPYIESLAGIDAFPLLEKLGIYLARGLRDLSDLASASAPRHLRELQLESDRGITRLDEIGMATNLEFLNISELRDIESLAPLGNLKLLDTLYAYGTTRVADGDLTPLMKLPSLKDLRMMNRRSYSPSVGEVKALLSSGVLRGE
ncbi:MAG TPA: hypothetical protein VIQ26_06930 [Microbacteriaceae bacterium]